MTEWLCKRCGTKAVPYKNKPGTWVACDNDLCAHFARMRLMTDDDFNELFEEA